MPREAKGELCARIGFTLAELLATIAITGILAAELLPVLSRAKGASKSTACKSNLRQLGVVLAMYLDESGGVYPALERVPAANARGVSYWFDALALSIPNAKWGDGFFKCPAYEGVVYGGESKVNNRGELAAIYSPCGSYAYNAAGRRHPLPGASRLINPGLGFSVLNGHPSEQPVRERDVRAPADLYAFGDAPLRTARWGPAAALKLGGAADYNSFVAENAIIEKTQHPLVFNMLFADTHIESVRTNVLLGTNAVYRSRWNRDNLP